MQQPNVLSRAALPKQKAYRAAVAEIIRAIQSEHKETDLETAERIGCSVGTVRNARNEENDLSALFLARIEAEYGAGSIDPYLALAGTRSVAIDANCQRDILPVMTRAQLRIVEARDPSSPGGPRETLQEQSAFLPDLIRLQSELEATIADIRRKLAA